MNLLLLALFQIQLGSIDGSALLLAVLPRVLWHDVTASVLPTTAEWTNRVALADIDGDGRVDLLFANGGNYSEPGAPEVLVTRFADFFVNVLLIFWVRDYAEQGLAVSQVHEEIHRRFREVGIEIPYPVQQMLSDQGMAAPPGAREA